MSPPTDNAFAVAPKPLDNIEAVTIRFAGDSGDGMQLAGTQFSDTSALVGNDIATLPDFPAEIRAPAGTLAGVSGYQIQFSSQDIFTPGDAVDTLIAMNPAALRVNVNDLRPGGIVIVNEDAFVEKDIRKAGFSANPLEDDTLARFTVHRVKINSMTEKAVEGLGLSNREAGRCKNMFALGLVYWLYDRPLDATLNFIAAKFAKVPNVAKANTRALKAGHAFGETAEMFASHYHVDKARLAPGTYRKITGNEAAALGLITASRLAGRDLLYASYPITPASDILHEISRLKKTGAMTFQAEDEIAAVGAAIGASFAGLLGATGTSGPGVALKSEAIGLAVMTELPLVIVDVQRGGPSTGLPTKTEQADLFQAVFGRNSECPVVVLAPCTPADCFQTVIDAFRLAVRYMTPVMVLSDGYLANGAEPWRFPKLADLEPIRIPAAGQNGHEHFLPYERNADLSRPWALPGTPGLEHRIGGLEKEDVTGNVSYDPANHEHMVRLRAEKVSRAHIEGRELIWYGDDSGDLLLVGWGSTYGAIAASVRRARKKGLKVSHCHLRGLNPLPAGLGEKMKKFRKVLVPELNLGQLCLILRARFLVDARELSKVQGQPFTISDITSGIDAALEEK
ncbi:MAG: 2-oxoglutarate oxidoreductase subunit KorA [Phycisphaerae bacterium]|nr:2-oxoglutarate oxidoreductase subunit KorA [Phycisphaerae bacterium]